MEKEKKKFSLALPPEQKLQDLVLFALMITDGAGRLALIVAAGISIPFRGEMIRPETRAVILKPSSASHFPAHAKAQEQGHTHLSMSPNELPASFIPLLTTGKRLLPPSEAAPVLKDRGGRSNQSSTPPKVIFH